MDGIQLLAGDPAGSLTDDVLALTVTLHRAFAAPHADLLAARAERASRPVPRDRLIGTGRRAGEGDWRVAERPEWLKDRRCEITGPAEPVMMVNALTCGATGFMADLEDALSPTWANINGGYAALRDAAAGTLSRTKPDGTVITPGDDAAVLVVRPRGLHLPEPRVLVDGAPAIGALLDIAAVATHMALPLQARGRGLGLYLPKLEDAAEAAWWHSVLLSVEEAVGVAPASIPVTVLVETLPLALQMDEVLYALRARPAALNAGRWDYLFSVIKTLGDDPAHILPDRSSVTMAVPFMAAYASRLVAICHSRGAQAIGGMAAFIPNRRKPEVTSVALAKVRADKEREAGLGYDGTWVAHPDLVPIALSVFDAALDGRVDQREVLPAVTEGVDALLDTTVPGGVCTTTGLRGNVSVGLAYLTAWLGGRGAAAVNDLMEDVATAEVSRCQVWQWVHHAVVLEDGQPTTVELVETLMAEEAAALVDAGADPDLVRAAVGVFRDVALSPVLPAFLTLDALALL
ncbi:malate synthase A [Acidothermaceae bacterium B102]|nr:malate synthase A [Acidothermaceae bacterium B102]